MEDITYKIKFGFRVYDDAEQTGVFRCEDTFPTIEDAQKEVAKTFKSTIQKTFPNAKNTGLITKAKYINGIDVFGRMDGTFTGGEFYIEIVRA